MSELLEPPKLPPNLKVIDHGAGWIAVNKESGFLSVPGRAPENYDSVLARVRALEPAAEAPHRLDMDTSGVIVVAVRRAAHRALCAQFRERVPKKRYEAVADGHLADDEGLIELPIGKDWEDRPRQKIDLEKGKASCTRYEVAERFELNGRAVTRVRLFPVTGRTHQLRVHLDAVGHPILGDNLYGTEASQAASERLLLHACVLSFLDPDTEEPVELNAAVPF